eukprot:4043824-Pyramimonas_sp.AAC.1
MEQAPVRPQSSSGRINSAGKMRGSLEEECSEEIGRLVTIGVCALEKKVTPDDFSTCPRSFHARS